MGVNLLHNFYQKNLVENEKNISFWEDYLQNLNMLDLNVFSEKLSVPVLVPVGSRMFFRGQLKHTNEITVALGADYFAKCSANQAQVLRQHRIKDAKSKLEILKKERDFLKEQLSFSKQNVFGEAGHDIIEVFTEEEDRAWRAQHRNKVKQYKQNKNKEDETPITKITDEELWSRLDELELQEELENELCNNECKKQIIKDVDDIVRDIVNMPMLGKANNDEVSDEDYECSDTERKVDKEIITENNSDSKDDIPNQTELDLLEQKQDKENYTLNDLSEQHKDIASKKEAELLAKLDEMEKREEMEDELNRLDGVQSGYTSDPLDEYEEDDDDDTEDEETEETDEDDLKLKRKVSFADENDSETLELTFKHSDVNPTNKLYDHKKGITKPSDVYEAFPKLFSGETSILKKTKYGGPPVDYTAEPTTKEERTKQQVEVKQDLNINRSILLKDVTEKMDHNDYEFCNNERPMSLFKKRRQQRK